MVFFIIFARMKLYINPSMERFRSLVENLPTLFDQGDLIFQGRNVIRSFKIDGEQITVKRFRKPSGLNAFIYGHLRKSKACRAFEHASVLMQLGIPTPEPIGYREDYHGIWIRETYLITRYSDYHPLSELTNAFPTEGTTEALDAFAAFTVELHKKGILHGDFNNGNTQWKRDDQGNYHFELIDINRMQFRSRELTRRESLRNLHRLTCSLDAYAYILQRYAEARAWQPYETALQATKYLQRFISQRNRRYRLKALLKGKK